MIVNIRKIEPRDIMRYYVAYYDIEKRIIDTIRYNKGDEKFKACHKYMHSYMGIGRNFKSNSAPMLLATIENMLRNEGNLGVEILSDRFVINELASKPIIKNLQVAASKLLWLYDHETIIMDNNNMKMLKTFNYKDYTKKWDAFFNLILPDINEVINKKFKKMDSILNEKWFKMRIFDMYLLSVYSENLKS